MHTRKASRERCSLLCAPSQAEPLLSVSARTRRWDELQRRAHRYALLLYPDYAERQQELSATEHHMKLSEESDARSVAELEARAAQAELREKKEHLEVVSQEAERLATALRDGKDSVLR